MSDILVKGDTIPRLTKLGLYLIDYYYAVCTETALYLIFGNFNSDAGLNFFLSVTKFLLVL